MRLFCCSFYISLQCGPRSFHLGGSSNKKQQECEWTSATTHRPWWMAFALKTASGQRTRPKWDAFRLWMHSSRLLDQRKIPFFSQLYCYCISAEEEDTDQPLKGIYWATAVSRCVCAHSLLFIRRSCPRRERERVLTPYIRKIYPTTEESNGA